MPVKVTDRSAEAMERYRLAEYNAIDAATNQLEMRLKNAFGRHYTTGAFRDTLKVRANIRRSNPEKNLDGEWITRVGIKPNERNANAKPGDKQVYGVGEIALAWELGHHNTFTRRYERVEIWVPTAERAVPFMQKAFARVLKRYMDQP